MKRDVGRNIYLTSYSMWEEGWGCGGDCSQQLFRPFGAGQPRRPSLRGLILSPAADQGDSSPQQQQWEQAGETVKAHSLA